MSSNTSKIYRMGKNTYTVTSENIRERLDTFIAAKSRLTRSRVQKLLSMKLVRVNAHAEKAGYRIKYGDRIEFTVPEEPEGELVPEDITLDILWEDEFLVAVNKPPRMVIYPAAGNKTGTMMNALVSKCGKLSTIGAPLRPGVVHRLDKDTSGAIVVAKDDAAYYGLVRQFKNREVEKHYMALLYGSLRADRGEIRALIGRSVSDRKKMSTRTKRGREAITRYEVMKRSRSATLVNIRIITGRTHQIRVHFASLGHPVLGDTVYGRKTSLKLDGETITFSRQMLHAHRLRFRHPETGEMLEVTAPVPSDMKKAIEDLS